MASSRGAGKGDERGQGPEPAGDLRSVLLTSVLQLEPLDVDLFRSAGPEPPGPPAEVAGTVFLDPGRLKTGLAGGFWELKSARPSSSGRGRGTLGWEEEEAARCTSAESLSHPGRPCPKGAFPRGSSTFLKRGRHYWVPVTKRLFGGQIVGQALVAAAKAVTDDLEVHSLHCYFVRAGDPTVPVLYQVERTRTGRSFSVRSVKAIQHGMPIFICQASFQRGQPSPVQHQFQMPAVPLPEELLSQEQLIQKYLRDPNLLERYRQGLQRMLAQEVPIEMKPVNPPDFFHQSSQEPKQLFWVRAKGYIGECDMKLHCCVAAYISDYAFLRTALLPHQHYRVKFMVSLDHTMWFHAPFRADQWMLYECESPWAGSSRGLVQGRLWRRDGVLAVSCAQEGVIRVQEEQPGSSKL